MSDAFANHSPGLSSPYSDGFAITPGASPLAQTTRAIYIGGDGDITVTMKSGASVTFAVKAGKTLRIRATHVTAATATGLIGLV